MSRHEKKVADQFIEKGLTTFLPVVTEVHRWSDRRKLVTVPLFPGYTFVRIVPTPEKRLTVLQSSGVVGFVGPRGAATPIPAEQIESVRITLSANACCMPYPYLRDGQRVRIRGGSLDGIEGVLITHNRDRSLIVSVDAIAKSFAIRLRGYDLEVV
jgi:transcription antitermination factor NusG